MKGKKNLGRQTQKGYETTEIVTKEGLKNWGTFRHLSCVLLKIVSLIKVPQFLLRQSVKNLWQREEVSCCSYPYFTRYYAQCNLLEGSNCLSTCINSKFVSILPHAFFDQLSYYFTYAYTFLFSLVFQPIKFFISESNWVNVFLNSSFHCIIYRIHSVVDNLYYNIKVTTKSVLKTTKHPVRRMSVVSWIPYVSREVVLIHLSALIRGWIYCNHQSRINCQVYNCQGHIDYEYTTYGQRSLPCNCIVRFKRRHAVVRKIDIIRQLQRAEIVLPHINREIGIVYSILCLPTNGVYVGMSMCKPQFIRKKLDIPRFSTHFEQLRNQRHPCTELQVDWDIYGLEQFIFEVLEVIELSKFSGSAKRNSMLEREAWWHSQFDSPYSKPQRNFRLAEASV